MGRKPNALILHYFERGAKLQDSSNRYEHTCRSCGEKFPKGRIDNLTAHLVKKCPSLSTSERQKVLLELNNLPALANNQNQQPQQHDGIPQDAPPSGIPVGSQWAPLRTLAEFAERSEQKSPQGFEGNGDGPPSAKRPRLALQEQYTLENPPVRYDQRGQGQKRKAPAKNQQNVPTAFTVPMHNGAVVAPPMAPPDLAMAAAAARHVPTMVDPALDPELLRRDEISHMDADRIRNERSSVPEAFANGGQRMSDSWQDETSMEMSRYPDIERLEQHIEAGSPKEETSFQPGVNSGMTEFSTEYGNGEKSNKPKVRSKFSESRRKEVQEVRKQGACIRCRMLRKPCGQGIPCPTCKTVESARLWKNTCRRDRVKSSVDLFTSGLHVVLASNEVNKIREQIKFSTSPVELHAFHYPNTIPAIFKSMEAQTQFPDGGGFHGFAANGNIRILDGEHDDIPARVEAYMKRMNHIFFAQEPSVFMHVTLDTANRLAPEKGDVLLSQALEFWALVHMLVDADIDWQIGEDTYIYDHASPNHKLMRDQINAAVERKVDRMARMVFPSFERRLMKSPAHLKFESFLIGLILINCVEKATWLYTCWEQVQFTNTWPLEQAPQHFIVKGEDLCSLVELYMHLRSIQPKTFVRPEDGIVACDESDVATAFFEEIKLNAAHLQEAQSNPVLDLNNSRSYEFRYTAKLLLPSGNAEAAQN